MNKRKYVDLTNDNQIFKSSIAIFITQQTSKMRLSILMNNFKKYGGIIERQYNNKIQYIFFDKLSNDKSIAKLLGISMLTSDMKYKLISIEWLTSCFEAENRRY